MWGINMTNTRILLDLCNPRLGDVIAVPPPLSLWRQKTWSADGPVRQPIGTQDGGGGSGKSVYTGWPRFKIVLAVTLQWWGGSTRCTRLIFINFISRSKKVKPKSKSCIKHSFTVYKLLRLWYFVSVLNLKFLDQLERMYCKDTPFFRPFYIGAPKGPFLPGLIHLWSVALSRIDSRWKKSAYMRGTTVPTYLKREPL
jgi:hypothetical protein